MRCQQQAALRSNRRFLAGPLQGPSRPDRVWRTIRIHQTRSVRWRWRRALNLQQCLLYVATVLPVLEHFTIRLTISSAISSIGEVSRTFPRCETNDARAYATDER